MIDRLWAVSGHDVSRETFEQLELYVDRLTQEAVHQNLIAASTLSSVWERHIFDSAQLAALGGLGSWVDIGSGAGLPGIVTAILTESPTTLVEPRRLRVQFLQSVVDELELANVAVIHGKANIVTGMFDYITARAVAPATDLMATTLHLSHKDTIWLLPKGRSAQKELDDVRRAWQGEFRLEPSRTDANASILVASGVRPRGKR